jgi:hypothetical protein
MSPGDKFGAVNEAVINGTFGCAPLFDRGISSAIM